MIFEFSKMEDTVIPNFYGGEKQISAKMHVDDNLKLMKGTLIPGASIGVHTHGSNNGREDRNFKTRYSSLLSNGT